MLLVINIKTKLHVYVSSVLRSFLHEILSHRASTSELVIDDSLSVRIEKIPFYCIKSLLQSINLSERGRDTDV